MIKDDVMTSQEVAELLHLNVFTVRNMAASGRLPATFVGKQYLYRRSEIAQWFTQERERQRHTRSGRGPRAMKQAVIA